jgi:hypothetical protein
MLCCPWSELVWGGMQKPKPDHNPPQVGVQSVGAANTDGAAGRRLQQDSRSPSMQSLPFSNPPPTSKPPPPPQSAEPGNDDPGTPSAGSSSPANSGSGGSNPPSSQSPVPPSALYPPLPPVSSSSAYSAAYKTPPTLNTPGIAYDTGAHSLQGSRSVPVQQVANVTYSSQQQQTLPQQNVTYLKEVNALRMFTNYAIPPCPSSLRVKFNISKEDML